MTDPADKLRELALSILQLIRERDSARQALHFLQHRITGSDEVFQEAGRMAGIPLRK